MRAGITKSRGGCLRCKRQKVRCDQSKPACGRCLRVGVECPGYSQQLKWSTKYERISQHNDDTEATVDPALSQPSTGVEGIGIEDLFSLDVSDMLLPDFITDLPFSPVSSPLQLRSPQTVQSSAPAAAAIDGQEDTITGSRQAVQANADLSVTIDHPLENNETITVNQLQRPLSDVSTVLTEFYFKEAASLYSVYDSPMNPFRSTVSQLWKSSRLLHCTLQSMSAACLLENFPNLASVGNELRREAIEMLQCQHEVDDTSLLALLMLGGSSSWHNTGNLGLRFFNLARRRLDHMVSSHQLHKDSNNYHFFEEALIYWELLLAYVADDGDLAVAGQTDSSERSVYFPSRHIPHPWTGVARDTQVTVQEVGRLVRRTRCLARSGQFTTEKAIRQLQQSIAVARELEGKLLTFAYPDELDIVSPGDRVTPVWHLLTLAEVYRRTGLAQLYRVFPDLLRSRLRLENGNIADRSTSSAWWSESSHESHDDPAACNEWLTTYALETLRMLETIPIESGTRDFQPFLLVANCSELRFPPTLWTTTHPEDDILPLSLDSPLTQRVAIDCPKECATNDTTPDLSLRSIEVVRRRQFILDRLTSFLRVLPPKPMRVCIDIVKASWSRIDEMEKLKPSIRARQQDVYWMDVMMDNKWETCMA